MDIRHLGIIDYAQAEKLMMELHHQRVEGRGKDALLVLQHTPVITRGRQLKGQKISLEPGLEKLGIKLCEADRGGLLTYHGPGQIVIYFVLKFSNYFKSVSEMVKQIEEILLHYTASFGVSSVLREGHPGVWVGEKKLVSVGLRIKQGVVCHGISFNVNSNLEVYRYFNPCGLSGDTMTNLESVLGREIQDQELADIGSKLANLFVQNLSRID